MKVLEKLQTGEMPPPGMKRPLKADVEAVTGWIESELSRLQQSTPPDPGRVTSRRLNRYEYNNTIRDLLGIDIRPAEDFPVDPYGYGFDNIGDVLSLSPLLTEKYLKAASRIGRIAVPEDKQLVPTVARYLAERINQAEQLHIETFHEFPVQGEYMLRTAWFQGYMPGKKFRVKIFLDGKQLVDQPVTIYTEMDRAVEAHNVQITAGRHKIEAEVDVGAEAKGPKPYLEYIQIHGPTKQVPLGESATYKRIFVCGHAPGHHAAACARTILTPLARAAYRRPATPGEVSRLTELVKLAQSRGDSFETGVRVALEALLVSPKFLFRIEQDPPQPRQKAHPVSDLHLASRLSYFLWSSMPDQELLALAEKSRLHVPSVLHAQVRRMLVNPKSQALVENFGGQWLQTRNLDVVKPDRKKFPEFDYGLRQDMRRETELFFSSLVREDRSILDFIDGPYSFLNERLAKFYGVDGVTGSEFRKVLLKDSQRSGILTQASVLTVSSYPTRTSPVIRGKWVLENILDAPPPPPPPDVPALEAEAVGTAVSMRQQLEKHRSNAMCASCHSRMDPLGFGLENYDAIGRWRNNDGAFPVDTSGVLPSGKSFNGPVELKSILKSDGPRFARGLSEKLLTYALGRGLEPHDRPAVQQIARRVEQNEYRFSELVNAIVDSVPFRMRRGIANPAKDLKKE